MTLAGFFGANSVYLYARQIANKCTALGLDHRSGDWVGVGLV